MQLAKPDTPQKLALCIALMVLQSFCGGFAIAAESVGASIGSPKQCKTVPIVLTEKFLDRLFEAVHQDKDCWVQSICAAVSSLNQTEYEKFVRLVREQSVKVDSAGWAQPALYAKHIHQYTNESNRALSCIALRAEFSGPDTLLDIYWITRTWPNIHPHYRWLKKAVEMGSPLAQYRMSVEVLDYGPNLRQPPPELAQFTNARNYQDLLMKSAAGNVAEAQLQLARFYLGREVGMWGPTKIDAKAAEHWYRKTAAQNVDQWSRDRAIAELGHLYFRGINVPQDYAQAFRWYSRLEPAQLAGCGELAIVLINLKQMYREGLGISQDIEKANELEKYPTACSR